MKNIFSDVETSIARKLFLKIPTAIFEIHKSYYQRSNVFAQEYYCNDNDLHMKCKITLLKQYVFRTS